MRTAFETVEGEILGAIRRLSVQRGVAILARPDERLTGREQAAFFFWTTPGDKPGVFTRAELERARDVASEIAHSINALAPDFTRWAVAMNFRRFTPAFSSWEWKLEVRWSIVFDPFAATARK